MAVITSLEAEPRSGGIRIQINGEPFVTVGGADVVDLGLRLGAEVSPQRLTALERRADIFAARSVASRMLAARALPSRELVRRLIRRGHPRDAAETAVAALVGAGIVNDGEFARHFARTRARRRVGPVRLQRDLQRFGITSADAEAAVQEAIETDGVDVQALLREAAARKERSLAGKDPKSARRSLRAYLLRQGFGAGDVAALLRNRSQNL